MALSQNCILNHQEIHHKVRRMAYQIYESNARRDEVILAGIQKNGFLLAEKIKQELDQISDLRVVLCAVSINKKNPSEPVKTSLEAKDYTDKSLVLIDDVLHSGTTLIYGVKHFLEVPLQQFKTAVLVNRNHKKYPVKADFKGISLSTSLHEHVEVDFDSKDAKVVLV
jgi:pyrimidine operon attenuation protein/uracil phosphoribosyltransferase